MGSEGLWCGARYDTAEHQVLEHATQNANGSQTVNAPYGARALTAERRDPLAATDPAGGFDARSTQTQLLLVSDLDACPVRGFLGSRFAAAWVGAGPGGVW